MKQPLKPLLFFFAIFISYNFVNDVQKMIAVSNENMGNPSCKQLASNEFEVHSGNTQGCLLWGYINFKGQQLEIDVKTFEQDTKVYYWWTTGQFLIKSEIKELDSSNNISIPNSRKARLHVRTECGVAHIKINEPKLKN